MVRKPMPGNCLPFRQPPTAARRRARTLATAAALVFGAFAPAQAGLVDDPRDQGYVTVVINRALETAKTKVDIPWSNPSTGNRGTIVIERTYYQNPSTPCREYRRTVERPSQPTTVIRGTGCRVGAGIWTIDETAAGSGPPQPPAAAAGAPAEAPAPAAVPAAPAKSERSRPAGRSEKTKPSAEARAEPPPPKAPPAPVQPPPVAAPAPTSQTPRVPDYTLPSKMPL